MSTVLTAGPAGGTESRSARLRALVQALDDNKRVAKAEHWLRLNSFMASELNLYLRNHRESGDVIEERELDMRDHVDAYLERVGEIELACLADYIAQPDDWDPSIRDRLMAVLEIPALRRYYERHYPMGLPTLLRLRIEHGSGPSERDADVAGPAFLELQSLQLLSEQRELRTLFSLLDDFVYQVKKPQPREIGVKDLMEVIGLPDLAEQVLASGADQYPVPLVEGILGISRASDFLRAFEVFAEQNEASTPLLVTGAYYQFEYWFARFDELGGRFHAVLASIATWPSEQDGEWLAARDLKDMERIIAHMQSLPLSAELTSVVDRARAMWTHGPSGAAPPRQDQMRSSG